MKMTFISSSEEKIVYFMSGEATNEIYIFFSLRESKVSSEHSLLAYAM